jgi:hypothetical protein
MVTRKPTAAFRSFAKAPKTGVIPTYKQRNVDITDSEKLNTKR